MLRTNLDTWRATLFVSLGLAASACAGRAESASAEGEEGDTSEDVADEPSLLAAHLRCEGDAPSNDDPKVMQCANGIRHRPAPPEPPECTGCPPRRPVLVGVNDKCANDDDCAPGALCIASAELVGATPTSCTVWSEQRYKRYFACQTPEDECGADSQCSAGQTCAIVGGQRDCVADLSCGTPGRPFLVGTEARVAGVRGSSDWCGPGLAPPDALDARSLSIVARHWQSAALMEHASIAAFARFTLQLLQLGAPLALVQQSQRAMHDETEHARRCFALAARYAGAPVGPATLAMTGAFEEESLASIVRLAFREGCVGETCAALEASEALALATDDVVRQTLALIAPDERRHAELAWRFVAWALEHDTTGQARAVMQAELERLRDEPALALQGGSRHLEAENASELSYHGILDARRHAELRRAATTEVVLPCAERLLATRADAHAKAHAVEVAAALSAG